MQNNDKGKKEGKEFVAFLLIKGISEVEPHHRYTLDSLKLNKKHSLVVAMNTPSLKGMIRSVNELGMWAELSGAALEQLKSKKKPVYASDTISVYRLSPPKGGFKRTIKRTSPKGILGKKDEESFIGIINRMI